MKKFGLVLLLLLTSITYSETINGHTLPPEPDPKINNATLLGIDSNNNGVRDDVERAIYLTYDKQIDREVLMQDMRAFQAIFKDENRVANIEKLEEQSDRVDNCISYLYMFKDIEHIVNKPIKNT